MKGFILGFLVATAVWFTFITVTAPEKKIGSICGTDNGRVEVTNYVSLFHVKYLSGTKKGKSGPLQEDKVLSCSPLLK